MKALESLPNIQCIKNIACADLYFTADIVITEIKQHIIVGVVEAESIIAAIEAEKGDIANVHYISNRVHDYSLKPAEISRLKNKLDRFKSYSAVTYNKAGMTILVFERMFLKKPIIRYSSLHQAVEAAGVFNALTNNEYHIA